jgi:valyl-tRNA synthetase
VNPSDERYQHLIGKMLVLPLVGREIPVIADDWANPEFGTGAVKVTPAHDPNDFAIGQRHSLPQLNIMDATAKIALPGSAYDGLDRFEARKRIVADLEASGQLVAVKEHTLTLPVSQRTGAVIEPRLSMQWFIKIQPLADKAIEAVDKGYIRFTPDDYRKTYDEWMKNIHDWCISRQLWWGHRIPAWHCGHCAHINVARETPAACEHCGSANLVQETDVLDTWFSSGLLPFTVFGWDGAGLTPDLAAFYPTQLLVTGFDILFFWVARMIMLGCHFMLDVPMPDHSPRTLADAVPFREVYIHALVRDADRQKMSKTKGNVIDPIEVVQKYGTDAVRFTLASQASPGTDIAFSEARTEGYRAFANKIWNAARFLQMQLERGREAGYAVSLSGHDSVGTALAEHTPLETRWIFARLSTVCAEMDHALTGYRFDEAANAVYQFFWGEFCDWYLELVKLRLDFSAAKNDVTAITLNSLLAVFEAALRLLSPFMPFLTEELWHALYASVGTAAPAKSIALTRFPQAADYAADAASETAMRLLQEIIVTVRGLRKELGVPEKEPAPVQVFGAGGVAELALANADMLAKLARVSSVQIVPQAPAGNNARATASFDVAVVYERQIDAAAERERLLKEIAKYDKGLQSAERQLGNEGFIAKAPAHIVEGLKKQAAEMHALKDKAEVALANL